MESEKNICQKSYFGGLFDSVGGVYFRIKKSNRSLGYKIVPSIVLHTDNEITYTCFDKFLIDNQIKHKFDNNSKIEITKKQNILDFIELIRGNSLQHDKSIKFIDNILYTLRNRKTPITKREFVRLVKTLEKIQPRRKFCDNVKYNSTYFKKQFLEGYSQKIKAYDIQSKDIHIETDQQYLSGFFDGCGNIRPVISENNKEDEIEYNLNLKIVLSKSWLKALPLETLKKTLNKNNINYSVNNSNYNTKLYISTVTDINNFVNLVTNHSISNYEVCRLTKEKILPAIDDDYHKSRQGIYDIFNLYEMVTDMNKNNRKYTTKFFEEEWNMKGNNR